MLFGDPNPHMIKKNISNSISKVGRDLALAINYVIKTHFKKKIAPEEKNKYNFAFDSPKKKCCKFSKSDT
jgi:hypothetical protein